MQKLKQTYLFHNWTERFKDARETKLQCEQLCSYVKLAKLSVKQMTSHTNLGDDASLQITRKGQI